MPLPRTEDNSYGVVPLDRSLWTVLRQIYYYYVVVFVVVVLVNCHRPFLPGNSEPKAIPTVQASSSYCSRGHLKCDGTRAENRFRLSAKRTSPFKSAWGASVQSTTGSRGVRISGSNAGYTMFRGSVKSVGYPLHSPVSPSLHLPCVTACHHISTGVYLPY